MVIPITRNSMLILGILSLFMSIFGFFYYFSSTKYDLVTIEGTLITSGESSIYGKPGKEPDKIFEFYIKEKPQIRFRINSLAYYYFKKNLRDSLGMNDKKVIFDVDKNEIDNPQIGSNPIKNVTVYTFRDEKYTYLSLEDAKKSDLGERKSGLYLGIATLICSSFFFWVRTTLPKP